MRSAQKKVSLNILYSRKAVILLKVLHNLGCISNFYFYKNKNKLIKIFPVYYKRLSMSKNINILSTPSRTFFVSYKALLLLNKKTGSSIYLLSTSKGVISHKTAISLKIGGVLVAFIVN